ncbi:MULTISPECIES: hypothetical protein [unclassified Actinotalea]|uniref:hypothetical protein n=1 Tax=unclassified Actinotalea TaxID=2638618 RepID=UPI0015F4F8B8|nr:MULTISPECIES: hypothetical protein [unclassified Actinotalea]
MSSPHNAPWQRTSPTDGPVVPTPGAGAGTVAPPGQPPATAGAVAPVAGATGIPFVDDLIDKAVGVPSGAIHAHVDRLRRRNPYASPAQIITLLEKQYLLAISTSGGAVGAAAAMPVVGTGVSMALTTTEVGTFFAASAAFSLAVADVHGIGVEETARRRALLMATLLGEQGATTVGSEAGINPTAWAKTLLINMPTQTIKRVNSALTRRLVRRQAGRQGALAFGRLAPFGIGAVIGATGARAMGRTVVEGAHKAFGPPPARFPREIELAVSGPDETKAPARVVQRVRSAIGAGPDVPATPLDVPLEDVQDTPPGDVTRRRGRWHRRG